ncbi:hypothetical protein IF125_08800 [Empedobacter stercoris]|uniref:hypothetical protein n=1 Tax=Empedobacter stercoris TaxID=1628248 RepID=UPI001CE1C1B4|nr:hypothetical protein [Empedobacter stercoris]MCA4782363.1 hypothetical protein [Empedobacter stercoris]
MKIKEQLIKELKNLKNNNLKFRFSYDNLGECYVVKVSDNSFLNSDKFIDIQFDIINNFIENYNTNIVFISSDDDFYNDLKFESLVISREQSYLELIRKNKLFNNNGGVELNNYEHVPTNNKIAGVEYALAA